MNKKITKRVIVVIFLILLIVCFGKDFIILKILTNGEHLMESDTWEASLEMNIYPGTDISYVNITKSGIIYAYCDNGYNDDDMIKYDLEYCKMIGKEKSKEIIEEIKKLDRLEMTNYGISAFGVKRQGKIEIGRTIECDGIKFKVDKFEFDNVIEKFIK